MPDSPADRCANLLRHSKFTSVLTGAGLSTAAGIPDFRGPKGLYVTRRYDPDTVFDLAYFKKDPLPFFAFARDFLELKSRLQPTKAHHVLREWEEAGLVQAVITQNIDSLHQAAGSQRVLELHGSFRTGRCLLCKKELSYTQMEEQFNKKPTINCPCGGIVKPDIVFFGEEVRDMEEAANLAKKSELMLVIGTTCVVYPAGMLPHLVNGGIVVINRGGADLPCLNTVLAVDADADDFLTRVGACLREIR